LFVPPTTNWKGKTMTQKKPAAKGTQAGKNSAKVASGRTDKYFAQAQATREERQRFFATLPSNQGVAAPTSPSGKSSKKQRATEQASGTSS
jgi:hypothetical protein